MNGSPAATLSAIEGANSKSPTSPSLGGVDRVGDLVEADARAVPAAAAARSSPLAAEPALPILRGRRVRRAVRGVAAGLDAAGAATNDVITSTR